MACRALGLSVLLTGLVLALGGCGEDGEESPEGAPERKENRDGGRGRGGPSSSTAERLCSKYRQAVTNVRFSGSSSEQAEDFRAAARAASAARKGASPGELGAGGRAYLGKLDTIIPAYEKAAAAAAKMDRAAFDRALDVAEPADEALDTFAERAGLERCSLNEPLAGESRVSQSGFPALIVPKGRRVPPSPDQRTQVYPLGPDESIVLERGPQIPTGTVSPARAAQAFNNPRSGFRRLEPTGALGDDQVPMRGYRYKNKGDSGILAAFSGQGHIWGLVCASRRQGGPSPKLNGACGRAAETAGFLMF